MERAIICDKLFYMIIDDLLVKVMSHHSFNLII